MTSVHVLSDNSVAGWTLEGLRWDKAAGRVNERWLVEELGADVSVLLAGLKKEGTGSGPSA
eukprot:7191439-Alexandrium_andersonii.AAC.1